MSLPIPLSASGSEPLTPGARRVRRLSRNLVWLFTSLLAMAALYAVTLVVIAVCFASQTLTGGGEVFVNVISPNIAGTSRLSDLPVITRVAGATAAFLRTAPWLFILWHLRRLFQIYAAGSVFSAGGTAQLKRIGLWLIACPIVIFAGDMLFRITGGPAPWFNITQLQTLVCGITVLTMAQVMDLGREIEQEKDSFI
jgi:hypothetical protein